jgi:hypothetical protein
LRFDDSLVFGNDTGQVVSVSRSGWIFDVDKNAEVDALNLIAVRNVPAPVPIWPGGRPQTGLINHQKVNWSPRPGLLSRSGWSDHLAWTEGGVRYSLEVKLRYVHSSIKDIAEALVRLA